MLPRILIVEDEPITAMDIAGIARRAGFEVVSSAANSEHALSIAQKTKPHIIIMDIRLGDSNQGILLADAIQKQISTQIIFISAFADPQVKKEMNTLRPLAFVPKPFSEKQLKKALEDAKSSVRFNPST